MRTPYSGTATRGTTPCSANGICGTTADLADPPLVRVLFTDESGFTLSMYVHTFSLLSHVVSVNSSHVWRERGADGRPANSGNITASNLCWQRKQFNVLSHQSHSFIQHCHSNIPLFYCFPNISLAVSCFWEYFPITVTASLELNLNAELFSV